MISYRDEHRIDKAYVPLLFHRLYIVYNESTSLCYLQIKFYFHDCVRIARVLYKGLVKSVDPFKDKRWKHYDAVDIKEKSIKRK